MEQILCPNCGERISMVERFKQIMMVCKEFSGQCNCGQKFRLNVSEGTKVFLSFPDKQMEILC